MKRKLLLSLTLAFALSGTLRVSGQLSGYYQQSFEGPFPPSGWQRVDVLDPAYAWVKTTAQYYSGTHSAYIHYSSGATVQAEDWLILPQFTVAGNDSFSFWLAAQFVNFLPDSTSILISTADSNLSSFTDVLGVLSEPNTYPAFANTFQYYSFSLAAYSGQNIYVAFKNRNKDGDGIYIDLVSIGNPLLDQDARAISIDVPDVVTAGSAITPKATVKNNSLTTQSFPVTMTITGGYSSTINVTNLASGAAQQIDFDPWTPAAGADTISLQTQLVADEDPANDTVSQGVTAFDPLSGYYQEDFEGAFPPAGWQTEDVLDPSNIWQQVTDNPYSGSSGAFIGYSPMSVQGEDWLILPPWNVVTSDSFSFWLAIQSADFPPDSTYIMISTTDPYISSFTNTLGVLSEGDNYPIATSAYSYYAFSLAAYAGQTVYVALKNRNVYGDGIYLDLVTIGTAPPLLSVGTVSISVPDYISSNTFSPMATVKNKSDATQSFPVTMTITGGYSSTINVTNLAAGGVQQITFDPWTPVLGDNTITVETQLPADTLASDDIATKLVKAFDTFINYGWTVKTPAPQTVRNEALASVNHLDGASELYALAGVSGGIVVGDNFLYDPVAGSWSSLVSKPTPVFSASAAAINDKIYLIGGFDSLLGGISDNQIYDIATNTWSNGTPLPTPVGDYAFGVYHDSLLYYMGGIDFNAFADYDLVQIYDPATDTWTGGSPLPVTGYAWQGGIAGNKIVVSGGAGLYTGLSPATYVGTINAANPALISWVQVDDFPTGTLFRPGAGASVDPSSGLVVFTGGSGNGAAGVAARNTFAYDVNSNAWKIGPDKPTAANNLGNLACVVYNDSMFMVSVGGFRSLKEFNVNEWLNLGLAPLGTSVTENSVTNFDISAFPNPFSKFTSIEFSLDHASEVKISIVDVMGKEITEVCNKELPAGTHQITWNASGYSAGVYFCKINMERGVTTQKLVKLN